MGRQQDDSVSSPDALLAIQLNLRTTSGMSHGPQAALIESQTMMRDFGRRSYSEELGCRWFESAKMLR